MGIIGAIYRAGFNAWNAIVGLAMTLFTTSVTSANGGVYATAHAMYNALRGISIPISTVFFIIAIYRDVIGTPPEQQARRFLADAVKFGVIIAIVTNLWEIMGAIIQITDGVTSAVATSSSSYLLTLDGDLAQAIEDAREFPEFEFDILSIGESLKSLIGAFITWGSTNLLLFVASVITLLIIIASGISILSSAVKRLIVPLALLPFGAISVAMGAGSGEAGRAATNFTRTLVGFLLSGAFMVVAVNLGGAFCDGLIAFSISSLDIQEAVLYTSIQTAIMPIITAGLVKEADSIVARIL